MYNKSNTGLYCLLEKTGDKITIKGDTEKQIKIVKLDNYDNVAKYSISYYNKGVHTDGNLIKTEIKSEGFTDVFDNVSFILGSVEAIRYNIDPEPEPEPEPGIRIGNLCEKILINFGNILCHDTENGNALNESQDFENLILIQFTCFTRTDSDAPFNGSLMAPGSRF